MLIDQSFPSCDALEIKPSLVWGHIYRNSIVVFTVELKTKQKKKTHSASFVRPGCGRVTAFVHSLLVECVRCQRGTHLQVLGGDAQ